VSMELATLGDLKLLERPAPLTLGPYAEKKITANIKVSSSDTAVIFGNLVYDVAGSAQYGSDRNCVILNEIRIDIMDYIVPAVCTEQQFRTWWREFEWENRVSVNTTLRDPRAYLDHLLKVTNMNCLTPKGQLEGDSGFIAANMYAKSVFGEDALANLSVERSPEGAIVGTVRIRGTGVELLVFFFLCANESYSENARDRSESRRQDQLDAAAGIGRLCAKVIVGRRKKNKVKDMKEIV